ncbi:MAG: UDP-N-acetylmuramoyl-L-alanyl-D-glutamate--2,6-diaminopimelate ligase [Chloroflexi bacterium]|nr:UDP-N-acetylmuramoyl-L-alanyl-D-glutamate--2,6-diaminopimelate ligase [Chloroflexota bacterium]
MQLRQLVAALEEKELWGEPGTDIEEIVFDSRQTKPGALFVAISGTQSDGHSFVPQTVARGVRAVIVERKLPLAPEVAQIVVPDSRKALALVSAALHGFPGRQLRVIGVTGTDGKTTTSTLIGSILEAAGHRTGVITTISARIGDQFIDTGFHTTTPDPPDVQRYMAGMVASGARYAVLETTSHGLAQYRTLGCEYDVAVITNITHEHLDFHGTFDEYREAKARLFQQLSSLRKPGVPKVSVTNVDDPSFDFLRQFAADVKLSYGLKSPADVTARDVKLGAKGASFTVVTPRGEFQVSSSLLGDFNVYNILAAISVGISQELRFEAIQRGIEQVKGITGRMEAIDCGQDFGAVVDFAHTPGSLEQALKLARTLTDKRVIVVFGCAGLRDQLKRPEMGFVAGRLADIVVITAEDPRTESLDDIMEQIAQGTRKAGRQEGADFFKIGDRGAAIEFAVQTARAGDLVIVTGKGHEQSMCFGTTEYPWSDHKALRRALGQPEWPSD